MTELTESTSRVIVIVHGAWGGGWEWAAVRRLLRGRAHDVYTPTLTGLGERSHLASPGVNLTTHIQDIVNVLEFEDLREVTLIGHSYGGMVITGVAERAPERLAQLIYFDAYAPLDGQCMLDQMNPQRRTAVIEQARTAGDGWRLPSPIAGADPRDGVAQPYASYTESIHVSNPAAAALPRAYIRCLVDGLTGERDGPMIQAFAPHAERARAEGWRYREIEATHGAAGKAPDALSEIILSLLR